MMHDDLCTCERCYLSRRASPSPSGSGPTDEQGAYYGTHHVWMVEAMIGDSLGYLQAQGWANKGEPLYAYPIWTRDWRQGAMFHTREGAETCCTAAENSPAFDADNRQLYWKVVAHDIEIPADLRAAKNDKASPHDH